MKAYAFIKLQNNSNPQGSQRGDIIQLYPIRDDIGKKTIDNDKGGFYLPVVMDFTIPCADACSTQQERDNNYWWVNDPQNPAFSPGSLHCAACPYNDPAECDVKGYVRAVYTTGDVQNPPKIDKKRRFNINIDSVVGSVALASAEKVGKSDSEKLAILNTAKLNELSKVVIDDKLN